MTQIFYRMYGTPSNAASAIEELREAGFGDVFLVRAPAEAPQQRDAAEDQDGEAVSNEMSTSGRGAPDESSRAALYKSLVEDIAKTHVLKADARVYAEGVMNGGAFVAVRAPFTTGSLAVQILDSHHPIDSGIPEPVSTAFVWDEATPLSSAFRLPVLTRAKLPFETVWNVPSVTSKPAFFSSVFGIGLLSTPAGVFSRTFGMSLLSTPAAVFSGALGLPLISRSRTPLSSLLGIPLLKK